MLPANRKWAADAGCTHDAFDFDHACERVGMSRCEQDSASATGRQRWYKLQRC